MTVAVAAIVFVLAVLVALAIASFFRHALTALLVLAAVPVVFVLQALVGMGLAVISLALLAVAAALIHTIADTFRLMRAAAPAERRPPVALAERRASARRANRSRIAA